MAITTERMRDDAGMTLLEVVIASVILFVAITAVFGLIIASTSMSVQAKQANVATNVAGSYIEYVRALPYESVGIEGTSIPGSLTAETSMSVQGIEVLLQPTVTWVNDPSIAGTRDYKRLDVFVRATIPNAQKVFEQTFSTFVREQTTIQGMEGLSAPPIVDFITGQAPAPHDVVYGSNVLIAVRARSSQTAIDLSRVQILVDGFPVKGSGLLPAPDEDGVASWSNINAPGPLDYRVAWNTTIEATGEPLYRDGYRTIQAFVEEGTGSTASKTRQVLVDNSPPSACTSVAGSSDTSTTARASWNAAMDGTDPAPEYSVSVSVQTGTDTWTELAGMPLSTPANLVDHAAVAFSRYRATVTPYSVRGLAGPAASSDLPHVSRSNLYGTSTTVYQTIPVKRWLTTNVLTLGAPTFPYYSGTLFNTWYRADSPTGPWTPLTTNSSFTFTDAYVNGTTNSSQTGNILVKYYRVKTVVQPTGYPSDSANASVEVSSATICNRQVAGASALVFNRW